MARRRRLDDAADEVDVRVALATKYRGRAERHRVDRDGKVFRDRWAAALVRALDAAQPVVVYGWQLRGIVPPGEVRAAGYYRVDPEGGIREMRRVREPDGEIRYL